MTSRAIRRCVVSLPPATEIIPRGPTSTRCSRGTRACPRACEGERVLLPMRRESCRRRTRCRAARGRRRPPRYVVVGRRGLPGSPSNGVSVVPSMSVPRQGAAKRVRSSAEYEATSAVRPGGEGGDVDGLAKRAIAWARESSSSRTRSTHGPLALTTQLARTRSSPPSSRSIASARSIRPLSAASATTSTYGYNGSGARRSHRRGEDEAPVVGLELVEENVDSIAGRVQTRHCSDGLGLVEEPRSRRLEAREAEVEEEAAGELPRWPPSALHTEDDGQRAREMTRDPGREHATSSCAERTSP